MIESDTGATADKGAGDGQMLYQGDVLVELSDAADGTLEPSLGDDAEGSCFPPCGVRGGGGTPRRQSRLCGPAVGTLDVRRNAAVCDPASPGWQPQRGA